jgi:acyl-CoA synthetase (AMP-forming)/AMP-acid ligase II
LNLAMLLDIPASIAPELPAVLAERDEPYGELRAAASQVAGLLQAMGVGPGERVAILSTNHAAYLEVLFGVAALGAVSVPVNFRARGAELAHLLSDSGAKALFTESRYLETIAAAGAPLELPIVVFGDEFTARVAAAPAYEDIADADDSDLALLLYTSGTTALPKGVMLTHGAISGYVMNRTECADGTDQGRMLLAAPLHHVAAIASVMSAIYGGRSVVMLPQFDAAAWLDAAERYRVTHAFVVPTMLSRIVAQPDAAQRDLSSLELLTYGAAPMPPSVIRRAIEVLPASISFSGAYGQTETTSTVAVLGPDDHRLGGTAEEAALKLRRLSSVGRAVDDVELRVVGTDGAVLKTDEVGEVQIRTYRAMTGYWGSRSDATGKTLDSEGWVHTGDLGYLDEDGYLFLGGRAGDLIIRGGENVAPEEVEAVLYEHPDVADAGVLGIADEEWGERIMAVVVARAGAQISEQELLDFCAPLLPSFKRPERVVLAESLPRTSTGKLLRRELAPLFSSPS